MDIRIDGMHEEALLRLMKRNGEKTVVAMTRMLIRDAAKKAGVWPEHETIAQGTQNGAITEPELA